jgi:hypothetical protein
VPLYHDPHRSRWRPGPLGCRRQRRIKKSTPACGFPEQKFGTQNSRKPGLLGSTKPRKKPVRQSRP